MATLANPNPGPDHEPEPEPEPLSVTLSLSLALSRTWTLNLGPWTLDPGDSWGSSCLLLESAAQDVGVGHVRALSQVQSIKIDRKTFLRIIDDWPNLKPALMRLRIWALHRRLLAGIKRLAMITKHPKLFGWTHHTARLLKNTSRTQLASIPEQSSSAELLMGAEARIVERVAQMIDAKLEGVKTLLEQHALSASAPRLAPLEA